MQVFAADPVFALMSADRYSHHRRLFGTLWIGFVLCFNVARVVKSMIKPVQQDCILKIRLARNAAVARTKDVSEEEMRIPEVR